MGEVYQYHITMLITGEQEDAIRTMFQDRNWPCWINVLSEETVANIRQQCCEYVFPETTESQDNFFDASVTEIKTEVINEDEADTDSALDSCDSVVKTEILGISDVDEAPDTSVVPTSNLITLRETPASSYSEPTGIYTSDFPESAGIHSSGYAHEALKTSPLVGPNISNIPTSNFEVPKKSAVPASSKRRLKTSGNTRSRVKPKISSSGVDSNMLEIPALKCITASGLIVSGTNGVPASGYIATETTTSDSPGDVRDLLTCMSNSASGIRHQKDVLPYQQDKKNCKTKDKVKTTGEEHQKDPQSQPYNGAFNYVWCVDCPLRFFTWEDLWKHRNEAQHELPTIKPYGWAKRNFSPDELEKMGYLLCNACNNYFPDRRKLRQHCYALHRELMPTPSCPICGEEFLSHKDLYKHKREKQHNDSLWLLDSYQCDTCGKHLTKYENFQRHKQLSCGKSETELEALRIHPCEVCGKRFKALKDVKMHTNIVHDNTETVCDICGKVCKSKFALRGHKRRHNEKNRKFVCDDCGKAFFNSALLKQHVRTHTKEKPFKCPLCEYTCSLRENVNKHTRNVHKQHVTAIDLRKSNKE